jgi:hypothetical protein
LLDTQSIIFALSCLFKNYFDLHILNALNISNERNFRTWVLCTFAILQLEILMTGIFHSFFVKMSYLLLPAPLLKNGNTVVRKTNRILSHGSDDRKKKISNEITRKIIKRNGGKHGAEISMGQGGSSVESDS